jgi:hypothetical protein
VSALELSASLAAVSAEQLALSAVALKVLFAWGLAAVAA